MLAVLTFAAPSLLIGLAAGLVPVLIHALLRPKARRLRFPPVRFFAEALASGQRAQRVRDGWLLALRAAAVCLAALLLAVPNCRQAASVEDANSPIAAAIVLDDSWSTRYQIDAAGGELELAIAAADATAVAAQGWPAPSLLGLFQADPSAPPTPLSSDVSQIRDRLRRIAGATPHAATLGRAIQTAAAELASARPNRRRLLIHTDLAAHAWRDVPGGLLRGVEHLDVRIVSPYRERRTNLAILAAAAPEQVHPQTAEVPIHAELLAEGIAQSATLSAGSGGESRARISPIELAPDQPQGVDILLPPTAAGVHGVSIEAAPTDRLPFDQVRYAAWEAGPRANVWLLSQTADATDADLTTTIYRNLLAPELLPASQHPVVLACFDPKSIATKLESPAGPRPDVIIALPTTELSDAARQGLLKLSEAGTVLLLAAGSSERLTDWPGLRRVFSPDPPTCEPTDATAVAWSQSSPFAGDKPGLRDIPGCAVRRRMILASLADGTTVHASFGDGRPAILSRRHGRGEIFLLTTSPDPAWSELGIRAAGLLSWLDAIVMRTRASAEHVRAVTVGQAVAPPIDVPAGGECWQSSTTNLSSPRQRLAPEGGRIANLPIRSPGLYSLQIGGASVLLAANWPAEESDLRPITVERLREILGTDRVTIEDAAAGEFPSTVRSSLAVLADPASWLAVVLLGVLGAEVWLASRRK